MNIKGALTILPLLKWAVEWHESRRKRKAAIEVAMHEQAVNDLNADLSEYHRTGKVPYDATIARHLTPKPTTRITIKPDAETLRKIREGKTI